MPLLRVFTQYLQASFAAPLDLLAHQTGPTVMNLSDADAPVAGTARAAQVMDVDYRESTSMSSKEDKEVEDGGVLLDGDHTRVKTSAGSSESDVETEVRSAEAASVACVVNPFSLELPPCSWAQNWPILQGRELPPPRELFHFRGPSADDQQHQARESLYSLTVMIDTHSFQLRSHPLEWDAK